MELCSSPWPRRAARRRIRPAYFDARKNTFENAELAGYTGLISDIKTKDAGTPVGASESIFAPLSDALGHRLRTLPEGRLAPSRVRILPGGTVSVQFTTCFFAFTDGMGAYQGLGLSYRLTLAED